ncbi:MAG: acyl carrier protein [Campylobacterales bacterium]|nr:acyl carrier protein [Campylobacterales bacterium]
MTKEQIQEAIITQIQTIAPEIERDDIRPDAHLQRSLEIDSFDFLKILTALKEILGVEVPEADYAKVDTLNKMRDYFAERMAS